MRTVGQTACNEVRPVIVARITVADTATRVVPEAATSMPIISR
jgi:hypothetical protein